MWFRNLLPYRLDGAWGMSPGVFEKRLAERTLQPCTGLTAQTQGWVSPRDDDQLVYGQGRQLLFALGTETKLLPASVVKDAAKAKAAQIEARMGFKPGKKQMRELREQIMSELLPKAFAKRRLPPGRSGRDHQYLDFDARGGSGEPAEIRGKRLTRPLAAKILGFSQ